MPFIVLVVYAAKMAYTKNISKKKLKTRRKGSKIWIFLNLFGVFYSYMAGGSL